MEAEMKKKYDDYYEHVGNGVQKILHSDWGEIVKIAEIDGAVDHAVPQGWVDELVKYGVDGRDYVWHYNEEHRHGAPLSRKDILMKALKNIEKQALERL